MKTCEICKRRPAEFAVQFISDTTPSVTTLGEHYRGYRLMKVCPVCLDINEFHECSKCSDIYYCTKGETDSGECGRCESIAIDEALHGDPENAQEYLNRRKA